MTKIHGLMTCLLLAGVATAGAGDLAGRGDVIRQREGTGQESRAQSLLGADVVDLEFQVDDFTRTGSAFSTLDGRRPPVTRKFRSLARSKISESLAWESGLDLAVNQGSRWDDADGERAAASMRPEYLNRFIYRPADKIEFNLSQVSALEQKSGNNGNAEFWRTHLAYKQQISRMSELRLEATREYNDPAGLAHPVETRGAAAFFSQQVGSPHIKLRLGGGQSSQDHQGWVSENRRINREETGVDWRVLPGWSLYSGAALEDEQRPVWMDEEERLLYEFRSRWSPYQVVEFSGGLSLDSRQQEELSDSGSTKMFFRGDLKPVQDLSLYAQLRWDQSEHRGLAEEDSTGEEKIFLGLGQNVKFDGNTRFSAEYAMAREEYEGRKVDSLVEHMISFVLSTYF